LVSKLERAGVLGPSRVQVVKYAEYAKFAKCR
jgi:hypothetical protein